MQKQGKRTKHKLADTNRDKEEKLAGGSFVHSWREEGSTAPANNITARGWRTERHSSISTGMKTCLCWAAFVLVQVAL